MENNINNILEIFGDKNISLQNITANDIIITTGNEENPEVTAKKKVIAEEIATLIKKLDEFRRENKSPEIKASEEDFENVDFDQLVEAIKYDTCVLFIGPEISVNKQNESLHRNFYESINSKRTQYDAEECFFMPNSEKKLKTKMMSYYNEDFHKENSEGYSLLEKVAQIPFSLIISSTPDDTFHRILDSHNKEHEFLFYNETEQECSEPHKDKPVIYNFLGNPADNGKYIFTHKQLHDYINQKQKVKVPTEIEAKIQEAEHFLFIGFNFELWQNRLALFTFNLETEGFVFTEKEIDKNLQKFLQEQFKISQVKQNYNDFIDILLLKVSEANENISLSEVFVKNTLSTLERIRAKTLDTSKRETLIDIEEELKLIKERFF